MLWMGLPTLPEPDPPLQDAMMFPGYATANHNMQLAAAHRDWLETQAQFYPDREWFFVVWATEAKFLFDVWHLLTEIQGTEAEGNYNSTELRRAYLAELKEKLGPYWYYQGIMPPPVPLWRFKKIE